MPDGFSGQVHVQISGDGVSHNQWRACQIRGLDLAVDAPFEVSVSGKHRTNDEASLVDGGFDGLVKRPRVPDTGGAAIADRVEAHGVQVVLQPGRFVVFGDHTAAGSERGSHPRLDLQAALASLSSQKTGRHHDAGV